MLKRPTAQQAILTQCTPS